MMKIQEQTHFKDDVAIFYKWMLNIFGAGT